MIKLPPDMVVPYRINLSVDRKKARAEDPDIVKVHFESVRPQRQEAARFRTSKLHCKEQGREA